MQKQISERAIVSLIGAVQFVNVLDFMMIMPLGPDLGAALGIPASKLGLLSFGYAAAASVAGALGALILDRFDRRNALALTLVGLALGTMAGGLSVGMWTMLLSRVLAGLFGGPATSVAMALLVDVVPQERRGRAIGSIMGAFSAASVLGVPAGLWLARHGGWRSPFFIVGSLGVVAAVVTMSVLPPMRAHLSRSKSQAPGAPEPEVNLLQILGRPEVQCSLLLVMLTMISSFSIVPNIAAYLQFNQGLPRKDLEYLYAMGGFVSFFSMRLVGRLVDRVGSNRVAIVGTLLFISDLLCGFYFPAVLLPIPVVFVAYMVATSTRAVAMNTVTTRVALPHERARYQSMQSAIQHLGQGTGSLVGAALLSELPSRQLVGMSHVVLLAMTLAALQPPLLWVLQRRIARRSEK